MNHIIDKFNKIHPKLVFTMEKSINDSINFIDLNIKVENNKIITNWYRTVYFSIVPDHDCVIKYRDSYAPIDKETVSNCKEISEYKFGSKPT